MVCVRCFCSKARADTCQFASEYYGNANLELYGGYPWVYQRRSGSRWES